MEAEEISATTAKISAMEAKISAMEGKISAMEAEGFKEPEGNVHVYNVVKPLQYKINPSLP